MHEAGLDRAGALVEVARILVKERGEDRTSEEITGAPVDKLCGTTFAVSSGPLPIPGIGVRHPPRSGWLGEWGRLKGGCPVG